MSTGGKHTPGPWRLVKHTSAEAQAMTRNDDWSVNGANGVAVCIEGWADEAEANARLIASAPDLLNALRAVVEVWPNEGKKPGWVNRWQNAMQQARDAIAKAEGKQ